MKITVSREIRSAGIFVPVSICLFCCWSPPSYEGFICGPDRSCPSGYVCSAADVCTANLVEPELDGGSIDADAGEDAGELDSGCGAALSCVDDPACDDENACTDDRCVAGCCETSMAAMGTACDDDLDACTADECDGNGACLHLAGNAGLVCRAAIDECDTEEVCSGDAACAVDAYLDGTACSIGTCALGFCLPLDREGLAAYLKLDEGGGDLAYDATRSGRDAILSGGPARIAGRLGGALAFDRADDRVTLDDFDYGPAFTISFWFRALPASLGVYQVMYSHGTVGAPDRLEIYLHPTGRVNTQIGDRSGMVEFISSGTILADGEWHLFTFTYAVGDGGRAYVDGSLVDATAMVTGDVDPDTSIFLGSRTDADPTHLFSGDLDDVRVFARRLDFAEVIRLYRASGGAPPVYLVPEADAYVQGGMSASVNFGTVGILIVKNEGGTDFHRDSFVRFDLRGLDPVATASLSLTMISRGNLSVIDNAVGFVDDDNWIETLVTFNDSPPTVFDIATFPAPEINQAILFDVSTLAGEEQSGDGKLSFSIRSPADQGGEAYTHYGSREGSAPPRLFLYW